MYVHVEYLGSQSIQRGKVRGRKDGIESTFFLNLNFSYSTFSFSSSFFCSQGTFIILIHLS